METGTTPQHVDPTLAFIERSSDELSVVDGEALRVMRDENVWNYFLHEYRKRHIGDDIIMQAILCVVACTQIEHSFGLHPKISGEKGTGKSSAVFEAVRLVEPAFVLKSSFSAKALFYSTAQRGMIIVSDDTKPDETTTDIIKRKITEYHDVTKHTVVLDRQKGGVTLEMPPEITFILTSVTDSADDQLIDRQWIISVDKNEELDDRYARFLLESAAMGFENTATTQETYVCRAITRLIRRNRYRVIIPMAAKIRFTREAKINRRALNIFIDLICCSAVINQFKRVSRTDESGLVILEATADDYYMAMSLIGYGAQNWRYKLSKPEITVYDLIAAAPYGISQFEIARTLKMNRSRVSQILNGEGKNSSGLAGKAPITSVEEVDKETGRRHTIWTKTADIDKFDVFASLDITG